MKPLTQHAEADELLITRVFDAPRDTVFEAWTSAEHARRWWYPRLDGRPFACTSYEMDFRVGGRYRYCMRSPEGDDYWARGEYRTIERPKRLAFTFQWEREGSPLTLITVTFDEAGAGKTRLTFRQQGFADTAARDGHAEGWREVLDHLADELARREGASA